LWFVTPQGEKTNATPDPKKMSTFQRGMQGTTADAIARGDEPP
jgi:hypothetical protein